MKSGMSAQKAPQELDTRQLLGGTKENNMEGVIDLPCRQIKYVYYFLKKENRKN